MTTPETAPAPYREVQGQVVQPSAMADRTASAVFALGGVLKDLLHRSNSFHSENDLDAAVRAVDNFVRVFVPASAVAALSDGGQRAPKEDVSQRTPSGSPVPLAPQTGPIDYEKLANAIVRIQQQKQAEQVNQ